MGMGLKELLGPPRKLEPCRNCDGPPRLAGGLYCEACQEDVDSLTRMALRQRHPPECFCVDCMCQAQRQFRKNQALAKKAAEKQPEPEPPWRPRLA